MALNGLLCYGIDNLWEYATVKQKDIGLAVNTEKTKYMGVGRHRAMIANVHITIGSNSYHKVKAIKYLRSLVINQNYIHDEK